MLPESIQVLSPEYVQSTVVQSPFSNLIYNPFRSPFFITLPTRPPPIHPYTLTQAKQLMVSFSMPLVPLSMPVMVVQEEMLVRAVPGKRNGSHPQAREQPLESIETAKRAIVPP